MIRPATLADVPALLAVKRALPMGEGGGFLLGSSEEGYRQLVAHADVSVAVVGGRVVGLAVVLPDPVLRASDVWARRDGIAWDGVDPAALETSSVAYFDQLAVLPGVGVRLAGLALALAAVVRAFDRHEHLMATTVVEPVVNGAALPYLRRAGARTVGAIDEVYPEVGPIRSAVHHLERPVFQARLAAAVTAPTPAIGRLLHLAGI